MASAIGPEWFPHKLGKKPAQPGAIAFQLVSYVDLDLPTPPDHFSHPDPPKFYDYDNSRYGDCVWAGAANETALWMHEGGQRVDFTTKGVLSDYAAVTGFDPKRPSTDTGTDVGAAARYRRHVGIIDARGKRQRIDAYASLQLGSVDRLRVAMWLLGGVGIGFKFPNYAMQQFKSSEPWDVKRWSISRLGKWLLGDEIAGGHYVPAIGIRPNGNIMCVSWGRVQEMTPKFYLKYADEVICYLDLDRLDRVKRRSPEGFDKRALYRDLDRLGRGRVYTGKGWVEA